MNERIKELTGKAFDETVPYAWHNLDHVEVEKVMKKFAELIVRDCIEITDMLSKLYPRTDVAFDVGYTMGTTRATNAIKKHFGVKE